MNGAVIRIVLKSRRRLVRDAICGYLATRPDFAVVGQTGDVDELIELCRLRRPDVAVADVIDLTAATVNALSRLRVAVPKVRLVVTYADAAPSALEAAVDAGITELVPSVRGLDVLLRHVREHARPTAAYRPDGSALTAYDLRIMSLMSSGHSVPEMAELLHISTRTVENHKRRLYVKMGVSSSGHAIARAASLGLVDSATAEGQAQPNERGRAPLVVVHGAAGPTRDAVAMALLRVRIPFVLNHGGPASLSRDHWAQWQRGPMLAVLVDPAYEDWLVPGDLKALPVVVQTEEPDLEGLVDILLRGAYALVRTQDVHDDLAHVINVVIHGYIAMNSSHLDDLAGLMTKHLASASASVPVLTARECEVLDSLAHGHTIRQTAHTLGIAAKTVENTQARLYRKLGARNRLDALTVAHRLGLLNSHGLLGPVSLILMAIS